MKYKGAILKTLSTNNYSAYTGERITREQANYNGSISYSGSPAQTRATRTAAVGLYPANAFGLHDMHGNVNEFTCSTYSGSYDGAESTCNQFGDNRDYVSRGGGWSSAPADIRSAARSRDKPDRKYFHLGFRIAIGDAP